MTKTLQYHGRYSSFRIQQCSNVGDLNQISLDDTDRCNSTTKNRFLILFKSTSNGASNS